MLSSIDVLGLCCGDVGEELGRQLAELVGRVSADGDGEHVAESEAHRVAAKVTEVGADLSIGDVTPSVGAFGLGLLLLLAGQGLFHGA